MNVINLSLVNAVSPYVVSAVNETTFMFTTDQGIRYQIGFLDDDAIQSCKTYQFYISKLTTKTSAKDSKIKPTIIAVIENFFEANNYVLLYFCETEDGKQEMRSRLFLRWFNTNAMSSRYVCRDTHLVVDDVNMYAAIIVRRDNPLLMEIEEEFDETSRLLTEGK